MTFFVLSVLLPVADFIWGLNRAGLLGGFIQQCENFMHIVIKMEIFPGAIIKSIVLLLVILFVNWLIALTVKWVIKKASQKFGEDTVAVIGITISFLLFTLPVIVKLIHH